MLELEMDKQAMEQIRTIAANATGFIIKDILDNLSDVAVTNLLIKNALMKTIAIMVDQNSMLLSEDIEAFQDAYKKGKMLNEIQQTNKN